LGLPKASWAQTVTQAIPGEAQTIEQLSAPNSAAPNSAAPNSAAPNSAAPNAAPVDQFVAPASAPAQEPVAPAEAALPAPDAAGANAAVDNSEPGVGLPARPADSRSAQNPLLPATPELAPTFDVLKPTGTGQYVLEFSRAPVVGSRLQLKGIYDESRLRFTRPRNWKAQDAKVLLRFRHSPALYATRSNLTVLVNGTSVGSVPLNYKQGEIGSAVYTIPAHLIQDYNELVVAALQNNSPTCTQDPFDPSLWTEVMPDSKLVLQYEPQPLPLNFAQYPYPFFDELSLEPNQVAYLLPQQVDEAWLTAIGRLQVSFGRFARYRPLETRLVRSIAEVKPQERLIIIGSAQNQPELAKLNTTLTPLNLPDAKPTTLGPPAPANPAQGSLPANQLSGQPTKTDGLLTIGTIPGTNAPVLVATGESPEGVVKAVQFLLQQRDRQIGTGQTLVVQKLQTVPSPDARDWPSYLPRGDRFALKNLVDYNEQTYSEITVRGAQAPAIEYDFKALPDDAFLPGNVLDLHYSYGPQVNPLTSLLEVKLDGVPVQGKKLDDAKGRSREILRVDLPEDKIKPNSKLQVLFQLDPRERRSCNRATDQQLWGTVHTDTSFELRRENRVTLPNLALLQTGFPFAAPQDLSRTAIVLPKSINNQAPSDESLLLMLEMATRLGRLSRSESIQLQVARVDQLSGGDRASKHLIAIGTQADFPFPQALAGDGFQLLDAFHRQRDRSELQTLPDTEGVLREVISPWNRDRVLLLLTAQQNTGLDRVRDVLSRDGLFFQLKKDTALVSSKIPEKTGTSNASGSSYDPRDYLLEFLDRAPATREVSETSWQERWHRAIADNWLFLIPGLMLGAVFLYGIAQASMQRLSSAQVLEEDEGQDKAKIDRPLISAAPISAAPISAAPISAAPTSAAPTSTAQISTHPGPQEDR
jgi:cellulose synthase operon protein B